MVVINHYILCDILTRLNGNLILVIVNHVVLCSSLTDIILLLRLCITCAIFIVNLMFHIFGIDNCPITTYIRLFVKACIGCEMLFTLFLNDNNNCLICIIIVIVVFFFLP